MSFPSNPTDGQIYNGYIWDSTVGAWRKNEPDVYQTRDFDALPDDAELFLYGGNHVSSTGRRPIVDDSVHDFPARLTYQGEPKYTFSKLMKLAIDGIFSFSTAPLRLATFFGLLVSAVAFLGIGFTVAQRLFSDWFAQFGLAPVPGYATIVISVLFIGGVQLVCLGLVGEYVGRIYDETKRRPAWIVQEEKGWEESPVDASPFHRLSGYAPEEKP